MGHGDQRRAGQRGGQALNFIVSNNNNALFSVQPAIAANGTLTYTPAANANGSATVTVQVHDDGGVANGGVDTSAAQTFTINVTSVNDVPSFTKGANLSVLNNAGAQTITGWATAISAGAANEVGQVLDFIVSNTNNALFSAQPAIAANGTLTYTPAVGANGSATVTVQVHDNGGTANSGVDTSAAQTFTITVTPAATNVAPVAGPITWNPAVDTGIPINTAVIASASFTDADAADTHTATINWGDGSPNAAPGVTEASGNGSVNGTSHTYTATGLYTAVLTVTDNHGGVAQSSYQYVVVVNPTGGSEIGMGSFASPLGAYTRNTTLSGSVTLTQLNAKYAADKTMNLGTNAFRISYSPASMSLTSTKMIWLVKTTSKSWLKGEGTLVTGSTPETVNYLLSVVDSTSVADKVRVKIWNKATGIVIYDNQPGSPDNADATQAVATGPGTVTFVP